MSEWTEQANDELTRFRRVSKGTVKGLISEVALLQSQCEVYRDSLGVAIQNKILAENSARIYEINIADAIREVVPRELWGEIDKRMQNKALNQTKE